jgi:hypothetical protein
VIAKRGGAQLSHELRTAAHPTIPCGMSNPATSDTRCTDGGTGGRSPHEMHAAIVAITRPAARLVICADSARQCNWTWTDGSSIGR